MSDISSKPSRPLSPHVQIYKPMLTTAMSILHRITGVALYVGTLLLAWFLFALASGEETFGVAQAVFGSLIGKLVLFGYTWALFHHMLGGLRHFIWDTGRGFELKTVEWMAVATIVGSLALTGLFWAAVLL